MYYRSHLTNTSPLGAGWHRSVTFLNHGWSPLHPGVFGAIFWGTYSSKLMLAQNSNIYIHLAPGMVNMNNICSDANSLTRRTHCA